MPPTLATLAALQQRLLTWCKECQKFGETKDPAELAKRFGPHLTLSELATYFRCKRCGIKGRIELRVLPASREYRT